jgi:diguanylate cyclase (GGDEF)-like protein
MRFDVTAKAIALFPLRRDERLSGIVLLGLASESGIAPLHVQFLKQLTAHAALALSNAMAYTAIEQHRQLLDRRLVQLQAVAHISQAISAHLNIEALLNEIVNVVQSTLGYRSALLSLVDTHTPSRVRRVAARGIPDEQWRMLQEQVIPLSNYKTLMAEDFQISRSFYIPHDHQLADDTKLVEIVEQGYRPELGHRAANEWHADDLLLVPLYSHRGGLVGILSVDDPLDRQRPTPETIAVLEIFATQAATAIANAQLYSDLERQALTDNLTGLANQRHFMLHLSQQVSLAQRHGQQLALLALDIDHFKSFNDSFGHLAGNVVLREFANILRESVRTGDQVARWGGEEFLVLLPQSTREGALEVAERIRVTVRSHSFPHRHVSVSVGVAVFTNGMGDDDLLNAADAALYRAKVSRDTVAT